MLVELLKRYYIPGLNENVSKYVSNCTECTNPPLEKMFDPCNVPEDVLEIDLVGELPCSNEYTHILTACDYFSRYLFVISICKPDTKCPHANIHSTCLHPKDNHHRQRPSLHIQHHDQNHEECRNRNLTHATVKHAQTIVMVERSHQKLKQILKINVSAEYPNGTNTLI